MVASVSSTPNPTFISQPSKRPPLLPSDPPPTAAPRRPKSREVTSRYLSSTPIAPRTAPNTPANPSSAAPKRSRSAERQGPEMTAAEKLLTGNGSKRSLSGSFQGEGLPVPIGKMKPMLTPVVAERRRNAVVDENSRPGDYGQQQRWPVRSSDGAKFTRSLDCSSSSTLERKKVGGSGGHVARALQLQQSMDDNSLSSVSGSTKASDLPTSDAESVSFRRPRAIAVPARFWQETTDKLRRLPEQNSMKKSFGDSNRASSPSGMPCGRGSFSPNHESIRPTSPSKVPLTLSPSRRKLSPSRVRSGVGINDSVGNTLSVRSFAADARRGKVRENKFSDMHELRMLHNCQLQWRFANARAAAAMQTQNKIAEKSLYNAWVDTAKLQYSVKSKRLELQQLRQQLKLYSILEEQMSYLDDSELLDGDFSNSLAGAVESLVASTQRLPLVDGAKANIREVEGTISSAVDLMDGIGSSLCGLLDKLVENNSLASEIASISSNERASLDQCRDLLSTLTAMQVEDSSLRTQMLQLTRMSQCSNTTADCA